MARIFISKFLITAVMILLSAGTVNASATRTGSLSAGEIPGLLPQKKKPGVKRPPNPEKAKKNAEAKDKQRRKDSEKYIEWNRKRSIEIQTPEVQERMKQNVKDANAQSKARKKQNSVRSKKAGRKYR